MSFILQSLITKYLLLFIIFLYIIQFNLQEQINPFKDFHYTYNYDFNKTNFINHY